MNSDATTMTQDTENLVDPPKAARLRGASMRKWVGIIQAGLSVVLVGLGVTVIFLRPPFSPGRQSISEYYSSISRVIDNTAAGIWGGAVFIITGTVGIFSSKTKNMVSLYLALCLLSILIAVIGVSAPVSSTAVSVISKEYASRDCKYQVERSYSYHETECCLSSYYCDHQYSGQDSSSVDYYGQTCEQIRQEFEDCTRERFDAVNPKLGLYAIMVAAFILEIFFSILGASFTCVGLCDCKKQQQAREETMHYFQLSPYGQLIRPTGTSDDIPPNDNATRGSQASGVMMLNTAGQPVQLTNHAQVNASQSPAQMIPTAQASQIINSCGQNIPNGQVVLVNTNGHVVPHMLTPMCSSQLTPPPSYTLSS